jgi:hypothetical protein
MTDLNSRPFRPDPQQCCDRCVFGGGQHADWCTVGLDSLAFQLMEASLTGIMERLRDATKPSIPRKPRRRMTRKGFRNATLD